MTSRLKLRKKIKKKKPKFARQDSHKVKRLKHERNWRRPKGHHSKVRRKEKQKGKMPSLGYRSPRKSRFLHPSGFEKILVSNLSDLKDIKKNQGIIIRNIGKKKKIKIIEYALKNKIKVLNLREPEEFLKKIKKEIEAKKEKKKIKKEEKKVKKEKKKPEKKEEKEEKIKKLEKKMEKSIQVKKSHLREKK